MRYVKWFAAAVLVAAIGAGCSSSRERARRHLEEKLDKASQLYREAMVKAGDPSERARVYTEAMTQPGDTPPPKPVVSDDVLTKLDEAEKVLTDALAKEGKAAPVATRGNVNIMLGQICLARGNHQGWVAEAYRAAAAERLGLADAKVSSVRDRMALANYNKGIAAMSEAKLLAVHAQLTGEVTDLGGKIAQADSRTADLNKKIAVLAKDNAAKLKQARGLRDAAKVKGGPEGLELLLQAQEIETGINANSGKIDVHQLAITVLQQDKALVEHEKTLVESQVAQADKSLVDIREVRDAGKAELNLAKSQAAALAVEAEKAAEAGADYYVQAAAREKLALAEFVKTGGYLAKAVEAEEARINKAKRTGSEGGELFEGLSDSQHLGNTLALKARANLAIAELKGQQLVTAKGNRLLIKAFMDAWRVLGRPAPAVVDELNAYLPDVEKTRSEAAANYKQAEEDLEIVQDEYLALSKSRWTSQAELAGAYLGHLRVAPAEGRAKLLTDAKAMVKAVQDEGQTSPEAAAAGAKLAALLIQAEK